MSTIAETPTTPTDETWIYAGKRQYGNGSLAEIFYDASGAIRTFNKLKGSGRVVGAMYTVKVVRSDKGVTVYGIPVWDGNSQVPQEYKSQVALWVTQTKVAEVDSRRKKEEKKLGDRLGTLTLDEIREIMSRARVNRSTVLSIVNEYILRYS